MKHYKVILSLWKSKKGTEKNRVTQEEKEVLIKELVKDTKTFFRNENRNQDEHYPFYYDDIYYFGSPIVLTAISEEKLKELLEFFKSKGLSYWIIYLYEMFNFEDLKDFIGNLKMEDINKEKVYLFQSKINLVNEYKNHKGVIQNNTEINKIIEATK